MHWVWMICASFWWLIEIWAFLYGLWKALTLFMASIWLLLFLNFFFDMLLCVVWKSFEESEKFWSHAKQCIPTVAIKHFHASVKNCPEYLFFTIGSIWLSKPISSQGMCWVSKNVCTGMCKASYPKYREQKMLMPFPSEFSELSFTFTQARIPKSEVA